MLKGLKIKFSEDKPSVSFEEMVEDKESVFQSALICSVSSEGSTSAFPTHGTTLEEDVTSGRAVTWYGAEHAGNFAALQAKTFLNTFLPPNTENRIEKLRIMLNSLQDGTAKFSVELQFQDGGVYKGTTITSR